MRLEITAWIAGVALAGLAPLAAAAAALPFDEETLGQIEELNRNITDHYEELQTSVSELEARRGKVAEKREAIEQVLASMDRDLAELRRRPEATRGAALRNLEEHRIEVKSRYLEALAEKHAIDLEATRSFEIHGSAILINLERLAEALEASGRLSEDGDAAGTQQALQSLQQGTAVALSVLESWGAMSREDPRFRALYATSRVLNRNIRQAQTSDGVRLTVDLVRERTFVVRSLIDPARALRAALDHQGLLLQVAAQNQMLRLHFNRLGVISGLELPDLDIEDSARRIRRDIEEEPFSATADAALEGLAGFDDCAERGLCN